MSDEERNDWAETQVGRRQWECELVGLCVKAGDNEGSGVCDGPGYGEHIEDFVTLDEDCDGTGGTGEVVVQ